jgi:mono/diheme cytochrome c family protein
MLKRVVNVVEILAVIGFAVFVLLLLVDQPDKPTAAATSSPASGGAAAVNGAAIFDRQCARCHGDKGQGGIGPKLNGGSVTQRFATADAELVIVKGGEGGMPAFENQLSPDELRAVVDFTRTQLQQR